jgi:hypothetical protein
MILITSGSYQGIKQAMSSLSPIASGGKVISKIAVMNSPGMNEKKRKKQARKLKRETKKFVKQMNKPYSYKPTFGYLIWFLVFKGLNKEESEHNAADHKYYSPKEYFVEVDLRFGQRLVLKIFKGLFSFLIQIGVV